MRVRKYGIFLKTIHQLSRRIRGMSDFQLFVADQLADLGSLLRFKRMFGGWGVYYGKTFWGMVLEGRLYFKTDETSRLSYIIEGMGPFTYQMPHRENVSVMKKYYEIPVRVLEDKETLCLWAERSISIAEEAE